VLYYYNLGDLETAYETVSSDMGQPTEVENIGDQAFMDLITDNPTDAQNGIELLFRQCNAFVRIFIQGTTDEQAVIEYAGKLSERINSSVCAGK
jgi:hypothetical protein